MTFLDLRKLKGLNMNGNKLTAINGQIFHGLQDLSTLYLLDNRIAEFPECSCKLLKLIEATTIRKIELNCYLEGSLYDTKTLSCEPVLKVPEVLDKGYVNSGCQRTRSAVPRQYYVVLSIFLAITVSKITTDNR